MARWPESTPLMHEGVLLISTHTPVDRDREPARRLIRQAISGALSAVLAIDPVHIHISSNSGQAPRLHLPGFPRAGLSISHEEGLSIAAVHLYGHVGVDLLRIDDVPDWHQVSRDYLGPQVTELLSATAPEQRAEQFARHWCARESALKCHGLALAEWMPGASAGCSLFELDVSTAIVGAVAIGTPYTR